MKSFILSLLISSACFATGVEHELIGGRPVELGAYPEIVYIQSGDGQSRWHCTATLIGPQVILTAGHCVANEGSIQPVVVVVRFPIGKIEYSAKCQQAPLYRSQQEDHDMALCKVDKELPIKPASISKVGPKIGDKVILTGYGCIQPGGGGGNDGTLRMGLSTVSKLPVDKDHWFYTQDDSALCFGDSGGPSLLNSDDHLLIGVNSRGNIKDLSLLTALWTPESIAFFQDFARDSEVSICGVTDDC